MIVRRRKKTIHTINREKLDAVVMFILGLATCENLTALFYVGTTGFYFIQVFSAFAFLYYVFTRTSLVVLMLKKIPTSFLLFFTTCILSIIPGLIYFQTTEILYRYGVGLIQMLLYLFSFFLTFLLYDRRIAFYRGLLVGYVANLAMSIFTYFTWLGGKVFTLSTYFPRDFFYVPQYSSFRAQGIFREPGAMLWFLIPASVILISCSEKIMKNKTLPIFLLFASLFVALWSTSGSVIIWIFTLLFYFICKPKTANMRLSWRGLIAVVAFVVLLALAVLGFFGNTAVFSILFDNVLEGADITSTGNNERLRSMVGGWEVFLDYPFGIGFNMTGTMIEKVGFTFHSVFNGILIYLMETGPLGWFFYTFFFVSLAVSLIKRQTNESVGLAVILAALYALQFGTGSTLDNMSCAFIGLAVGMLLRTPVKQEVLVSEK